MLYVNLRYIWHSIISTPGSTLTIVVLLALGTGGVLALYNPITSILFTPLPLSQPEQLVRIGGDIRMFNVYQSSFEKEESLGRIFSNIAAYVPELTTNRFRISETGRVKETYPLWVTEGFFETLGVKPIIGYDFSRKEHQNGVVVSYRFWRDELMSTDNAIGNQIFFGTRPITIVGIMPEGFNFPIDNDLWLCRSNTGWPIGDFLQFVGRLRPGISASQAADALKAIDFNSVPGIIGISGPVVQSLQTFLYGDQYSLLRLLGVVSILFLVLVCAGVINLLIAQGSRRKQEIATRLILGATRRNLVLQLLREILPLAVIGGLVGWWLSDIVNAWLFTQFPALHGNAENLVMKIFFWIALVLIATILAGFVPSLYATSINLNTYLKAAIAGKRRFIFSQEFLVGVQLSIALALLIGMGVLLRSMMHRIDLPIGWSSQDIVVVSVHPLETARITNANRPQYAMAFNEVQRELRAMPEVISVGYLSPIPFTAEAILSSGLPTPILKNLPLDGSRAMPDDTPAFNYGMASPDGFDILGIPFVLGRPFTEEEVANRVLPMMGRDFYGKIGGAAIVNQAAAKRLWPGENAIGKIFYDSSFIGFEVVGIVQNYHQTSGKNDFEPTIFRPMPGATPEYELLVNLRSGTLIQNFQENIQKRLSGLTVVPAEFEVRPLSDYTKDAMANRRLTLQLLGAFAVLGIIVSGLGVFATATLMAESRKLEMGIRIAVGAQTWDILRLALWRGIRAILVGIPSGLLLAWVLLKVFSSYLVQVNISEPLTWVISCAMLIVITTVAALIPALRASRINPMTIIRK